jgi:hypothetical protein
MFLRIVLLIFAFLLLGAHFLRSGNIFLIVVSVLTPCLLLVKKRWSLLLLRWLTYFGALVWIHTTFVLVRQRIAIGAPWGRMLLILAGVTVFTFCAGYLLNSDVVKRRYQ